MIMTAYRQLLQEYVPRPIRSERACQKTLRAVEELMGRPALSRAESELLDVLVALVEQYESIQYPTPSNPPDRMLAHLIESKGISQAELAAATDIPRSTISAVLAGRQAISTESISKLAEFFGVSPSVFMRPVTVRLPSKALGKPEHLPAKK
jgi:HTH-type transcriptional regulator/antitoxin HigA